MIIRLGIYCLIKRNVHSFQGNVLNQGLHSLRLFSCLLHSKPKALRIPFTFWIFTKRGLNNQKHFPGRKYITIYRIVNEEINYSFDICDFCIQFWTCKMEILFIGLFDVNYHPAFEISPKVPENVR